MEAGQPAVPWRLLGAELLGTALLVAVGLSLVILGFGRGSPVVAAIASPGARRAIVGFLFGTTGALITLSPLGRESGAHINPAVTLAFVLLGQLRARHGAGYVLAQLAGGVLGAVPLLAWGAMGRSVDFGATLPGPGFGTGAALAGETATTFALIVGLFLFLRHPRIRRFTPALFPLLYAVLVWLEAPVSGTSTNPARSLGPAVIADAWRCGWVYWAGPLLGTLLGVAALRLAPLDWLTLEAAKLHHFGHDRYGILRRGSQPGSKSGRQP